MRERVHKGSLLSRGVRSVTVLSFHPSMLWGQRVMLQRVVQGLGRRQGGWKLLPKVCHDLSLPAGGWSESVCLLWADVWRQRAGPGRRMAASHSRRSLAACAVSACLLNSITFPQNGNCGGFAVPGSSRL